MAAVLVGGALLSAFLQVAFDRLASPQVLDFFRGRKIDEKLLINLKTMLNSVNALADDAEQKQFRDPNVKSWLSAVKEAIFDAEDILDEIDYELTKCKVETESKAQPLTYKKLEYLERQKDALGLKELTSYGVVCSSKVSQKLPSTSLRVESVIYGRDADKEMIFNWLTSKTENGNQPSILSIVGMGGLGKTTLAQHVYDDQKMKEAKFDIKAWVCVSDDFDVLTVTKAILEEITDKKDDSGNLQMVHKKLKKQLYGKKFFLVLDDVWNERPEKWEVVQIPLSFGAPGSRILVTTRVEKVASNMRSRVHRLKQLEEDECWKVFERHALRNDDLELNDEKKENGRRIVEKCNGLPLALKTIGCLLHTKSSISDWQSISESNIWDTLKEDSEIIPALFLSYHHLPSYLKRCFAYCALFPKDYEFLKNDLISMWMTENFIQCSQISRRPEEVGDQYFHDLLSRSFFEQSSRHEKFFVMHDLLNDLAKYVCEDLCFRLKFDKGKSISERTRHFSFAAKDVEHFDGFGSLIDAKRLRTFFPITRTGRTYLGCYDWQFKISLNDLFSEFKFLRVLCLFKCSDLREVPESLGDLEHLNSLDLSRTNIQKLPDSTCLLYNLLILKLNYCYNLEELPLNLHKLIKLRCIEFTRSKVAKMPMHLGELKNLQVLSTFFVDKNSEFSTKQLGGLDLHGDLSIKQLQNITSSLDALAMELKNKTHLVTLKLKWNKNHIPNDPRKEKEVLENLHPSKLLKLLSISNYGGTLFPSWVFDNSLSNLVFLGLEGCKYCLCLPPLGLLSSIKILEIIGLEGIVSIGAEFYGSNSCSFRSLEKLYFYEMKEWECTTASFPRLQHLFMSQCPKLKGISENLFHLKKLSIRYCDRLIISGHNMNASSSSLEVLGISSYLRKKIPMTHYDFLEEMEVNDCCDFLTIFPLDFFPKLRLLQLINCQNLKKISQEHTQNYLKELTINECPQFESFPTMGLSAPSLVILSISALKNLKLLPKCMRILLPSLTRLSINDCPQVEMFPNGGLPSNVKHVTLSSFKLIASLKESMGMNTRLESLCIEKVNVESFPEGLLPHSLSLRIYDCPNITKLDYKGLFHLSSLTLHNCPNLKCLPEEGLPISISILEISGCPLLKQRCQKPDGKDWGKIATIQYVNI